MQEFVNLTSHDIKIVTDGEDMVISASGGVARMFEEVRVIPPVHGLPCVETRLVEVNGLPEPREGTVYLVSPMVAGAVGGRLDVFCPDTGPDSVVRNDQGQIIGVRRLRRIVQ